MRSKFRDFTQRNAHELYSDTGNKRGEIARCALFLMYRLMGILSFITLILGMALLGCGVVMRGKDGTVFKTSAEGPVNE